MSDFIRNRYTSKVSSANLGCANLLPYLHVKTGNYVLDLGCGSGGTVFAIAPQVGSTGRIYGLDLTSGMIEAAIARNNYQNVFFHIGDIHSLPFENALFDTVLSNCVINHSQDKATVFSEIFRVLKPDGCFMIGDVMAVGKLPEEIANNSCNVAACWGGAIPKDEYFCMIKAQGFCKIEQLSSRFYQKENYPMESIIVKGVKS
ncbi:MAG: ubiquinone biosynthesis protein UbiE [Candidatus Margulisiibacteriota bacterium]|nr:MAG: hypothetical protein A2X43_06410 [Candidatus Margulisbacteria bacterium GWD2_39_127]OGI05582.1 MAG: hypothetical protein A2X42_08790 [Candidatus Margulisbacteria bacterium GWF2_38_17]OGI07539.1 MAG: hypothetical protein A2X41_08695 [Candidatus Margulisbacteria bacterium GWE2_39_32]PZM84892.1 MAG: ubiquinone biosynthesis protein UbiE [Candidatus Margulisiibacteriota bacterium]HAR64022.1 ubiquinone biosynthesis protein UbiE [Candidatus Margulisiibacteriota bacterium]